MELCISFCNMFGKCLEIYYFLNLLLILMDLIGFKYTAWYFQYYLFLHFFIQSLSTIFSTLFKNLKSIQSLNLDLTESVLLSYELLQTFYKNSINGAFGPGPWYPGDRGLLPRLRAVFFHFQAHTEVKLSTHPCDTQRTTQLVWSLMLALYIPHGGLPAQPALLPGLAGRRSLVRHSGETFQVHEHTYVHGAPSACLVPLSQSRTPLADPRDPNLLAASDGGFAGDGHVHPIYTRFGESTDTSSQQLAPHRLWPVVLLQQPVLIPSLASLILGLPSSQFWEHTAFPSPKRRLENPTCYSADTES